MPNPKRGDIWTLDWNPGRGSEQTGKRPALVVQSDAPNRNERYPNTIVVAISEHGRDIPSHVLIAATEESGLKYDSYAKCEQILTVSKDRLETRLGEAAELEMRQAEAALKRMLSLP